MNRLSFLGRQSQDAAYCRAREYLLSCRRSNFLGDTLAAMTAANGSGFTGGAKPFIFKARLAR